MRWLVIAIVSARVAAAEPEGAPEPIRLVYDAPEGCPDASAFFAGITARAKATRVETGDAREFRVAIVAGEQTRGTLVVTSRDGDASTRDVSGATCGETVAALALVAALAIEQRAAEVHAAPLPRPAPWRIAVGSGIELELGTTPDALPGVPLFVAVDRGWLALRAGATRSLRDDATDASFRWTIGFADACARVWHVAGCAGVEAGVLAGTGTTVGAPVSDTRPWLAPRERIALSAEVGPIAFALEARLAEPIVRDRFYIAPAMTLHQTPWLTAGFGATAAIALK